MNLIDSFYQKVEEGKKGNNMGIPSGFPKLDKYIYGIQRRFMSTVIADSGAGKSSVAIFMYIYKPLVYSLEHPEIPVNILALSFEMSKEVLLAKLLSLYILDKYHIDISYSEIFSLDKPVSDDKLKYIYDARDWLTKVDDKLTIYDTPLNSTGVYNILRAWAGYFGKFETDDNGERYIKNDRNQYLIAVLDHCKLLKNNGSGIKHEIDETAKHFIYYRNLCDMTICAVQQANRQFKSMDRRNSEHNYLELQDAQDTADMTQASEIVIGVYHPFREKKAKCEGFDIKKLRDQFRLIQLLKGRFGQSDVVEGCIFQGSIGYFKELDPPKDGKRFDYDRVLRMDYLFEEFDNQQKKKEELDDNIKEDEEDEVLEFNFNV